MTKFDADFDVKTDIKSIKIVFVFVFIFAFKKSITSKKKSVKTNSNVDDVIIIIINQSWFWISFYAALEIFSISIHIFFRFLFISSFCLKYFRSWFLFWNFEFEIFCFFWNLNCFVFVETFYFFSSHLLFMSRKRGK